MAAEEFLKIMGDDAVNDSERSNQINLGASSNQKNNESTQEDSCDWREKVQSFQDRSLTALKNSILTDITLEVGPDCTPFHAHKLFLALGSPVFEAMFYGPLADNGEKIAIPDIMPDGFEVLLRYLYGDIAVFKNETEALNTWIAADKYCIPKLVAECNKYFDSCPIFSTNVWKLLENAIFLNLKPLICRCKQYLEKHTESSLRCSDFLETKSETVMELLLLSSTDVSELFMLKSVIHWGRQKVSTGAAPSLDEVLRPLLPCIRFGALTPSDFCQFLDETNDLLEMSDALAILKHLTKPLQYALPSWCCTTGWQRSSFSNINLLAHIPPMKRGKELKLIDQTKKQRKELIDHKLRELQGKMVKRLIYLSKKNV